MLEGKRIMGARSERSQASIVDWDHAQNYQSCGDKFVWLETVLSYQCTIICQAVAIVVLGCTRAPQISPISLVGGASVA